MIIPIGWIVLGVGVIVVMGFVIYIVFENRTHKHNQNQESEQPALKVNKAATTSLVLGLLSAPPSLCWLSIILDASSGGGGDFQGGIMILALCFWVMAPVGLFSVVAGISALINISKNRLTEKGNIQAIAGIILGLPGTVNSLFFLYSLLSRSMY